jgi:hypothetical protein
MLPEPIIMLLLGVFLILLSTICRRFAASQKSFPRFRQSNIRYAIRVLVALTGTLSLFILQ